MNNLENKEIELLADFDDVLTVENLRKILKVRKKYLLQVIS